MRFRDRRTNYSRGADFERRVRDVLMHEEDACTVIRSAGSRGIVDLVALFTGVDARDTYDDGFVAPVVWIVQCKRDGKITDDDRELLAAVAGETGAIAKIAYPITVGRRGHVVFEHVPSL